MNRTPSRMVTQGGHAATRILLWLAAMGLAIALVLGATWLVAVWVIAHPSGTSAADAYSSSRGAEKAAEMSLTNTINNLTMVGKPTATTVGDNGCISTYAGGEALFGPSTVTCSASAEAIWQGSGNPASDVAGLAGQLTRSGFRDTSGQPLQAEVASYVSDPRLSSSAVLSFNRTSDHLSGDAFVVDPANSKEPLVDATFGSSPSIGYVYGVHMSLTYETASCQNCNGDFGAPTPIAEVSPATPSGVPTSSSLALRALGFQPLVPAALPNGLSDSPQQTIDVSRFPRVRFEAIYGTTPDSLAIIEMHYTSRFNGDCALNDPAIDWGGDRACAVYGKTPGGGTLFKSTASTAKSAGDAAPLAEDRGNGMWVVIEPSFSYPDSAIPRIFDSLTPASPDPSSVTLQSRCYNSGNCPKWSAPNGQ